MSSTWISLLAIAGLCCALMLGVVTAGEIQAIDKAAILSSHNSLRAKHGSPPLTWSADVEAAATAHAAKCSFFHDEGDQGENLAASADPIPGDEAWLVDAWYDEIGMYNFSAPAITEATGHFSQLVWAQTRELGCAAALCTPLGGFNFTASAGFLVCRYTPAGNVEGEEAANVWPVGGVAST